MFVCVCFAFVCVFDTQMQNTHTQTQMQNTHTQTQMQNTHTNQWKTHTQTATHTHTHKRTHTGNKIIHCTAVMLQHRGWSFSIETSSAVVSQSLRFSSYIHTCLHRRHLPAVPVEGLVDV